MMYGLGLQELSSRRKIRTGWFIRKDTREQCEREESQMGAAEYGTRIMEERGYNFQ